MGTEGAAQALDDRIRFDEPATGFTALAPPDFALSHDPETGVYELRSDSRHVAFEYRRLGLAIDPLAAAFAEARARGLNVASQTFSTEWASLETLTQDGRHWSVQAAREEDGVRVAAFGMLEDGP